MTTERAKYDASETWQDKIRVMALYHYSQIASQDKWLIRNTAEFFGISTSTVAENLFIAKHMSEVKELGSRNKALKKLRGFKVT